MEERKGNGIFLGIVSVATLIVAIIGATFAYFSASTESNTNAINFGAYEFKLTLDVEQIYPKHPEASSGLIPLTGTSKLKDTAGNYITRDQEGNLGTSTLESDGITYLEYAVNVATNKCIDDNGLQVCALYRVIIKNKGSNPVTLTGQIKTTANIAAQVEGQDRTPFSNLAYISVVGNHEDNSLVINKNFATPVKVPTTVDELVSIAPVEIPGAEVNLETGEVTKEGEGYSYVLIYLNDEGDDQSPEMGAKYEGQLIYSSGTGVGNNLTGTFTVGGTTEESTEGTTENTEEPATTEPSTTEPNE